MTEFVLVGCTKSKRDTPAEARDLYDESPLFRKRRKIARERGDKWAILSAEHGLVMPSETLAPYDTYLGDRDGETWAGGVMEELGPWLADYDVDEVTIFAGSKYVDPLVTPLESEGYDVLDPLRGLMPGQRMSRLDDMAAETEQTKLVTDGGREQDDAGTDHRPPREDVAHMVPPGERWDDDNELVRRVCPNCRLYFETGEDNEGPFCGDACRRRHERGEYCA